MILVDTGPLVALCDPRDARHRLAIAQAGRLVPLGVRVCDPVLTEACFHLPQLAQRERLRALLAGLGMTSLPSHDTNFRARVFDWLLKYEEHEPDWADGCLVALCDDDGRLKVWTYDREFRTTWRRADGSAVPLAVR